MTASSLPEVRIRVSAAVTRAHHCAANRELRAPTPTTPQRAVVLGDPQASLTCVLAVLDHQGLLGEDGWLRPDIQLICVGDYFDFSATDLLDAGYQGLAFLAWLAAHCAHPTNHHVLY